jgi:hypothetical protein
MAGKGGIDSATRAKIVVLYRSGKPVAEITERTGAPRSTIYYVLRQVGVSPNRQGPSSARPQSDSASSESVELLRRQLERCEDLVRELSRELGEMAGENKGRIDALEQQVAELRLALREK